MSSEKVRASHLLVKHQGSRRPASWRDPDGHVIRRTSREDAIAKVRGFKNDIESGKAKLGDLAVENSDCSSAKRGGDLGWSRPGLSLVLHFAFAGLIRWSFVVVVVKAAGSGVDREDGVRNAEEVRKHWPAVEATLGDSICNILFHGCIDVLKPMCETE